jgi:hypothetical protein
LDKRRREKGENSGGRRGGKLWRNEMKDQMKAKANTINLKVEKKG